MSSTKVKLVVLLAIAVALVFWLRSRGGSDGSGGPDGSTGDDRQAQAGGGDSPGSAGSSRAPRDHSFGEQYRFSPGAASSALTGKVIDAFTGEGVADVDVTFRSGGFEETATSGAGGDYSVQLAPGSYVVRAVGDNILSAPQPTFKVGRVREPLTLDIEVMRLALVRGRVTYADGAAAGGATVGVRADDPIARLYLKTGEVSGVEAGPDGSFELRVPVGDVELRANDGQLHGFTLLKAVAPASERSGIAIVLEGNVTIKGVVRAPDGHAVGGADVHASVRRPRASTYETVNVRTDDSGRFGLEVRSGMTILEAGSQGYAPAPRQSFTSAPGDEREVVLSLQESLTLAGRVVDSNGDGVSEAVVTRRRRMSKLPPEKVVTERDGSFEFTDLDSGPQNLKATKEGYGTARLDGISAGGAEVKLVMVSDGGLRGTVTSAGGAPVRQFVVRVSRNGRAVRGGTARFFADDGRYEIFPLEAGSYDVVVSGPGHAPGRLAGVDVPASGWGDGSVEMGAGGRISGTVSADATGKPISGARVTVVTAHGAVAITDSDGRFELARVAPGERTISVSHPEFETAKRDKVKVRTGYEVSVDVSLTP